MTDALSADPAAVSLPGSDPSQSEEDSGQNGRMDIDRLQFSLTSLILVVACIAVNIGLFRVGPLWGLIGINISKHLLIAHLCRNIGVDREESHGTMPR